MISEQRLESNVKEIYKNALNRKEVVSSIQLQFGISIPDDAQTCGQIINYLKDHANVIMQMPDDRILSVKAERHFSGNE